MECKVRWTGEGMAFLAETGSNHLVAMDGAPDGGGRNLVEHAIRLSHEKYWSASIMLAKTAEITTDYEIVED